MFPFNNTYVIFFYLGIFFFITHIFIYGVSLDLSYFGLLLIYIGWRKPVISDWILYILWFFIFINIYFNVDSIKNKINKWSKKPANKTKVTSSRKTHKTPPPSTDE
jgi:hypothetical protein